MGDKNRVLTLLRIMAICSCVGVIILIAKFLYDFKEDKRNVAKEVIELRSYYDWTKMPYAESKYRGMMIDILTTHGFKYDPKFPKAMNKDMKIKYINENYDLCMLIGRNFFDVPTIHQLETAFNPYAKHKYGEAGIGGIKFGTALWAETVQRKYMPPNLAKRMRISINTAADLKDPIVSLRITHILLWWGDRVFDGREDWNIGTYHWGGFYERWWDGDNSKRVKDTFILNGIAYNTLKYYATFRELKSCYNLGQLSPSRAIQEKWEAYTKSKKQEELDFRTMKNVIRVLQKRIRSYLEEKLESDDEKGKLKLALDYANKQLLLISREIRQSGGIAKFRDDIRKEAKKLRSALLIKHKESKVEVIIAVVGIIVVLLFLSYSCIVGTLVIFRYILSKRGKKNESSKD